MTIKKGEDWGSQIVLPSEIPLCASDAEVADAVRPFAVTAGDLFRCLGSPRPPVPHAQGRSLPVDALVVTIDGLVTPRLAVSSVEIGSWWSRHEYVCISNTGFVSERNLAPRSHPNDGRFEIVRLTASLRQRVQIDRRSRTGAHLPHPGISVTNGTQFSLIRTESWQRLRIDGRAVRQWNELTVSIAPDHFTVLL